MMTTFDHSPAARLAWLEAHVEVLRAAYIAKMDAVAAHFTELSALPYPSPRYSELFACTDDLKDDMSKAGAAYRAAKDDLDAARAEYQASRG